MNADRAELGQSSAAFALAGALTVLFNTVLTSARYIFRPLEELLTTLASSSWALQGWTDVVLFVALGLIFSRTNWARKIAPHRLIAVLAVAVVLASTGLFVLFFMTGGGFLTRYFPFLRR